MKNHLSMLAGSAVAFTLTAVPMAVPLAASISPEEDAVNSAGSPSTDTPPTMVLRMFSKQDYYTSENDAQIVVHAAGLPECAPLRLDVTMGDKTLIEDAAVPEGRSRHALSMDLLPLGENEVTCTVISVPATGAEPEEAARSTVSLVKHPPKRNEVKIDLETGGFIVEGRPFYPFGFYAYTRQDLPEEHLLEAEVVNGFNVISPYQANTEEHLGNRSAYMDRCAKLGLKVHYQVQALAGGGGVLGQTPTEFEERMRRLKAEIETFRDHPALLAWYIADEPGGRKVRPEHVQPYYDLIKAMDPYHPVTIVFIHLDPAVEFASTFDVVMTDPYVIPGRTPAHVADVTRDFVSTFRYRAPLMVVPQAFGGNEWWEREPTRQELRLMTYLSVIHRSTGIQYFIRSGLNAFPKSTAVWGEAGMIAEEMRELTPWLLSSEPRPMVTANADVIHVSADLYQGTLVVLAANAHQQPRTMTISLPGYPAVSGEAYAVFENRTLPVTQGVLTDMIDAYGSRAYRIRVAPGPTQGPRPHQANRTLDPSFEDCPSAGVPAHCYATTGRGATYWVDSTEKIHGLHALRLTKPTDAARMHLSFFPVDLQPGKRYQGTVWAKGRPGETASFRLSLSHVESGGSATFALTDTWQPYVVPFVKGTGSTRSSIGLSMASPGIGWFDLLQVYPVFETGSPPAVPAEQ